jgi:hypothetical protein
MSIQFDLKNLLQTLTCPIDLEPLTTAVNLSPCCHKVNQVAAEKYYGKIIGSSCAWAGKTCVLCNEPVLSYAPDHTIRSVAAQVFDHQKYLENLLNPPQVLQPSKIKTEEKPAEMKTEKRDLPYPGLPADFMHLSGDWDQPFDLGTDVSREMIFTSSTPNSLLRQFTLVGYCTGNVAITAESIDSSFKDYLHAHRCRCEEKHNAHTTSTTYITNTHADLKILFKIIAHNNKIPKAQFNKIAGIVKEGFCGAFPRPWRQGRARLLL